VTHSLHIVLGVKTSHEKSSCPENSKNKGNYDFCKLGLRVVMQLVKCNKTAAFF